MRIEKNHWFVRGNELSISSMSFFIRIVPVIHDDRISTCLIVKDDSMNEIMGSFDNYEKAIDFAENYVYMSDSLDSVKKSYDENNKSLKLVK